MTPKNIGRLNEAALGDTTHVQNMLETDCFYPSRNVNIQKLRSAKYIKEFSTFAQSATQETLKLFFIGKVRKDEADLLEASHFSF